MNIIKVGIDRILCKGLHIKQIDIDLLRSRGFTVIQENNKAIRILKNPEGQDVSINYIKVSRERDKTLKINELRIGQKEIDTVTYQDKINYTHLDVTLPRATSATGTNENNVNSSIDLMKALEAIQDELERLGFGRLNLLGVELKEIEINVNINLDRPFQEYEKALTYLQGLAPLRIKTDINSTYKPSEIYTGFKVGNQSIQLKMYDKRANIKRKTGKDIGLERLRIEYTLLSERKIMETLGSNRLKDIIDNDFKTISKAFMDLLKSDIIDKIHKDTNRQIKHATREIERYKRARTKLSGQEYIFDYEVLDIEIVLQALKENTTRGNYAKQSKTLIDRCIEGKQVYLFGNVEKLNEILEKLGQETIKIPLTRHVRKQVKNTFQTQYKRH